MREDSVPRSESIVKGKPLSVKELSHLVGIAPSTLYKLFERGLIPGHRFGRLVRFDVEEVFTSAKVHVKKSNEDIENRQKDRNTTSI